ncbi:tetratricopeptide repeat protein, partial [Helicobacter cetorum]|uniref:tetratricopeptide repeat protein n=1 Tax=Helicobacter cetorum TaxID=138563 RepID=UPI0018F84CA4
MLKKVNAYKALLKILMLGSLCVNIALAQTSHKDKTPVYEKAQKALKSKDYKQAFNLFKQACESKNDKGCYQLGKIYPKYLKATNKDKTNSAKQITEFYKQACELGNKQGCYEAGFAYNFMSDIKDYKQAFKIHQKGCDLEYPKSCDYLANMYEKGQEVAKDSKMALELHQKAFALYQKECDLKNGASCYEVGLIYSMGQGIEKDNKLAFNFYKKACEL